MRILMIAFFCLASALACGKKSSSNDTSATEEKDSSEKTVVGQLNLSLTCSGETCIGAEAN